MSRIKEYVIGAGLLAFLVGGANGCCPPGKCGGPIIPRQVIVQSPEITYEAPKVDIKDNTESASIDDLLTDLKDLDNALEVASECEHYRLFIDIINHNIKLKNFNEAEKEVRELAEDLERDDSNCAKELLEQLKRFAYIKYQYFSPRPEKKLFNGKAMAISTGPPAEGDKVSTIPMMKTHPDGYFNKILVNPYSGTESMLEQGINVKNLKK